MQKGGPGEASDEGGLGKIIMKAALMTEVLLHRKEEGPCK